MKLGKPENENYAATVVELQEVHSLEGSDNILGTTIFGFQAIVGKDTHAGQVGLVFPAETQLSQEYGYENNLHEHGNLNKDEGAKGYLGDNRRVRVIRLRKHTSSCLFMPLESLSYIKGFDPKELKVGDTFDKIGDHDICNKYVIKQTYKEARLEKNKTKFIRVDKKFLPEHYDSDNYFRNTEVIPDYRTVVVTQKLHGTSIRVGNTIVSRRLRLRERIGALFGIAIATTEYDYVFGSRKVIKDVNNPNQNHFYTTDIWTEEGKKLEGLIPEGYLLYGELVGYTASGEPIQKNYTYQTPVNTAQLFIYRVATVSPLGFICDLSWDQTTEFCRDRGLKTVPEIWRGTMVEAKQLIPGWMDIKFKESGYTDALALDPESPCDEGVCIRVDGIAPYILKAKSPLFYEHETAMLDEEALDLEAEGSTA